MFAVSLFILFAQRGAAEYAHGAVSPWRGEIVPIGIELHKKSMLTYPGTPDPPLPCYNKTVNFHDFTRGLVAMKPVGKKTCLIKTSGETYDEMKKVVDGINNGDKAPKMQASEDWINPKTPIPTEDVTRRVGNMIANFCSGCKVYILQDGKATRALAGVLRARRKIGCFLCFRCTIHVSPETNAKQVFAVPNAEHYVAVSNTKHVLAVPSVKKTKSN